MEIEKVIFLDIDGVLATIREHNMTHIAKTYIHKYDVYPFNPKCVAVLNEILIEHNPIIVLSTDWRILFNMDQMADIFKINGVRQPPVMGTPNLYNSSELNEMRKKLNLEGIRGVEIKTFLNEHKVDKFVVIDDLNMEKDFGERFIHCECQFDGITKIGLKDRINKLLC